MSPRKTKRGVGEKGTEKVEVENTLRGDENIIHAKSKKKKLVLHFHSFVSLLHVVSFPAIRSTHSK